MANLGGFLLVSFVFFLSEVVCDNSQYGILKAQNESSSDSFCIIYYSEFAKLPSTENQNYSELVDMTSQNFCQRDLIPASLRNQIKGKFVLTIPFNCSLAEKASTAQNFGCKGLLVAMPSGNVANIDVNSLNLKGINVVVALISQSSIQLVNDMEPDVRIILFSPHSPMIDYSFLIIWAVAMFTVVTGGYWSGLVRQSLHTQEISKVPLEGPLSEPGSDGTGDKSKWKPEEDSTINVSPKLITCFVLCMGVVLLLLYYFFHYLVYVIIGFFVLASIVSVYNCLEPLIFKLNCHFCKLPLVKIHSLACSCDARQILLLAFAVSLSITWLVLRKESYSWVLQDTLGIAFSINMLKSFRLPSLKICSLLLILLFFYDIFFVFITPYLTESGTSVMVEVATGGNSKEQGKSYGTGSYVEQLPMVLRVPHYPKDPLAVCFQQYSLLGFGDILVPGLLVAYCHGIDMFLNKRKVYFIATTIAYGLGLLATYVGLYMMSLPQPALLYLVPATLLPTYLIAWAKGEFGLLWHGVQYKQNRKGGDSSENSPEPVVVNVPTATDDIGSNAEGGEIKKDELKIASIENTEDTKLLL